MLLSVYLCKNIIGVEMIQGRPTEIIGTVTMAIAVKQSTGLSYFDKRDRESKEASFR